MCDVATTGMLALNDDAFVFCSLHTYTQVGLSLLRYKLWHFSMFSIHIIGYAISDTALASLISRYSDPDQQVWM